MVHVLVHLHGEHLRKTRSPGWSRSKKRHFRAPERTKVHEERRIMTLMKRLAKLVNGYLNDSAARAASLKKVSVDFRGRFRAS